MKSLQLKNKFWGDIMENISVMEHLMVISMAHMFGDYFLQTNYLAMNKGKDNYILLTHCLLYGLGVYGVCLLFGFQLTTIDLLIIIGLHIPMDYIKARGITPKYLGDKWSLVLDQFVHYMVLIAILFLGLK